MRHTHWRSRAALQDAPSFRRHQLRSKRPAEAGPRWGTITRTLCQASTTWPPFSTCRASYWRPSLSTEKHWKGAGFLAPCFSACPMEHARSSLRMVFQGLRELHGLHVGRFGVSLPTEKEGKHKGAKKPFKLPIQFVWFHVFSVSTLEEILALKRQGRSKLGQNHPHTVLSLINLGSLLQAQGAGWVIHVLTPWFAHVYAVV